MKLKTINNTIVDLADCTKLMTHSLNDRNCTHTILNQINAYNIYSNTIDNKSDQVIIDLGANVGLFSVFIHERAKTVYAVEPTIEYIDIINEICTLHNISNIIPLNIAVGATTNLDNRFFISEVNTTMNSLIPCCEHNMQKTRQINVYDMNDLFRSLPGVDYVDFIKMDIEGAETDVITSKGFKECSHRIKSIYIEVHNFVNSDFGNVTGNVALIYKTLADQGFNVTQLSRDSLLGKRA